MSDLIVKHDISNEGIADALEKCDWAGASIGNKAILQLAIQALRNPRPAAPVEGLETVGATYLGYFYSKANRAVWPAKAHELVTRSQAVAIIAAKDERIAELEDENYELKTGPWPEWANAVLKVIRERSGYDGYDDTSEGVDLPVELEECMAELEADNAALAARVRELEETIRLNGVWNYPKDIQDLCVRAESLETQLAAAEDKLDLYSGALNRAVFGFDQIHKSLMSNGPKQASGEVAAFFLAETKATLEDRS
ncbi:hypothetical protein [Ochrobactrum sp. Marseille-Q0166]|uniref:hypothetical protein n=1 Tax=Ochrobactrum sp. Marseille-Q0166 TaxID=2761105 RepID=UPI00165510CB|nr:hypothetical protein [Ochrobactrum sp. Marseille-Q0166]MBC8718776.1 hypothetical protein [Ochrobactrum sp. Marseille-Q0166]